MIISITIEKLRKTEMANFKDFLEDTDNNPDTKDFGLLFEMANVHPRYHGIDDVVIWVGMENKKHGLRVKISNQKNKFNMSNHFNIQMPSLDYNPKRVPKWITTKKLNHIFDWIKLNQELLYKYEKGEMDDTGLFLNSITKI